MINEVSWSQLYNGHLPEGKAVYGPAQMKSSVQMNPSSSGEEAEPQTMDTDEIGAIAGGCVVGGIILIVIVAFIIYLVCLKPKSRHRDEIRKHKPDPHDLPSNHSQRSSLNPEGPFPKVSGTGLWLGTPGLQAVTPSPAYYLHKSAPPPMVDMPPSFLQRGTSERRAVSSNPYVPPRVMFSSHSNMFLMPVPGPQRIYHSQQLGPIHEMPPHMISYSPAGMEIYECVPIGGGTPNGLASRSKLAETKHSPYMYNDNFMMASKLDRSYSDAHRYPKPVPHKFPQSSLSLSQEQKSQHSFKDSSVYIREEKKKLVSSVGLDASLKASPDDVHGSYYNKAFSRDSGLGKSSTSIDKPNVPHLIAMKSPKRLSQPMGTPGLVSTYVSKTNIQDSTDSLKIFANNKTDDQKTQPSFNDMLNSITLPEVETDLGHKEYTYTGLMVPKKTDKHYANTKSSTSSTDSGAYSEDLTVSKSNKTNKQESLDLVNNSKIIKNIVDTLVLPDISDGVKHEKNHLGFSSSNINTSSYVHSNNTENRQHVNSEDRKHREILSSSKSTQQSDAITDDLTNAGKITDTAFQFLDTYLSEDDGTTDDSPPLSPALA